MVKLNRGLKKFGKSLAKGLTKMGKRGGKGLLKLATNPNVGRIAGAALASAVGANPAMGAKAGETASKVGGVVSGLLQGRARKPSIQRQINSAQTEVA